MVYVYVCYKENNENGIKSMRHGATNRRQRNRGGSGSSGNNNNGGSPRRGNGPNRMQVFDSNGPDVRIRGTAYQVTEKYMNLAKDAASAGDRVLAESYLQHAEHYQRIISTWDEDVRGDARPQQQQQGFQGRSENVQEENAEGDLSLPGSILGSSPYPASQAMAAERTPEVAAE